MIREPLWFEVGFNANLLKHEREGRLNAAVLAIHQSTGRFLCSGGVEYLWLGSKRMRLSWRIALLVLLKCLEEALLL